MHTLTLTLTHTQRTYTHPSLQVQAYKESSGIGRRPLSPSSTPFCRFFFLLWVAVLFNGVRDRPPPSLSLRMQSGCRERDGRGRSGVVCRGRKEPSRMDARRREGGRKEAARCDRSALIRHHLPTRNKRPGQLSEARLLSGCVSHRMSQVEKACGKEKKQNEGITEHNKLSQQIGVRC